MVACRCVAPRAACPIADLDGTSGEEAEAVADLANVDAPLVITNEPTSGCIKTKSGRGGVLVPAAGGLLTRGRVGGPSACAAGMRLRTVGEHYPRPAGAAGEPPGSRRPGAHLLAVAVQFGGSGGPGGGFAPGRGEGAKAGTGSRRSLGARAVWSYKAGHSAWALPAGSGVMGVVGYQTGNRPQ